MIGIDFALVIIMVMFWIGLGMTAEYVDSNTQQETKQ